MSYQGTLSYEERRELRRKMRKAGFMGTIGGGAVGLVAASELTRRPWQKVQRMRSGGRIPASAALFAGELGAMALAGRVGERAASRHAGRKYLRGRKEKRANEDPMNEVMLAAFQAEIEKISMAKAVMGLGAAGSKKSGLMARLGGLFKRKKTTKPLPAPKPAPKAPMVTETNWAKRRSPAGPKIRTKSVAPTTLGTFRVGSSRSGVSSSGSSGWGLAPGKVKLTSAGTSGEDIMMAAFLEELEAMGFEGGIEKDAFVKKLVTETIPGVAKNVWKGLTKGKKATKPVVDRSAAATRLATPPVVKPKVKAPRTMTPARARRMRETASYLKTTRAADKAGTRLGGRHLPNFPKGIAGRANA